MQILINTQEKKSMIILLLCAVLNVKSVYTYARQVTIYNLMDKS